MVGYLEVRHRVTERSSFNVHASVNHFRVSIMYVSEVSEDSVYEHWFYGISDESRKWLIQVGLIIKENKGNSIQVFGVCEPHQCTKRQ